MIPDFKTFIGESVWSDMQDRGSGDMVKKEDDYMTFDTERFADYLDANYVFTKKYDNQHYNKITKYKDTVMIMVLGVSEYGTYYVYLRLQNTESGYQLGVSKYIDKTPLIDLLKEKYIVTRKKENDDYLISPQSGEVNNKFFIEVLDFLIDNAKPKYENIIERAI